MPGYDYMTTSEIVHIYGKSLSHIYKEACRRRWPRQRDRRGRLYYQRAAVDLAFGRDTPIAA